MTNRATVAMECENLSSDHLKRYILTDSDSQFNRLVFSDKADLKKIAINRHEEARIQLLSQQSRYCPQFMLFYFPLALLGREFLSESSIRSLDMSSVLRGFLPLLFFASLVQNVGALCSSYPLCSSYVFSSLDEKWLNLIALKMFVCAPRVPSSLCLCLSLLLFSILFNDFIILFRL